MTRFRKTLGALLGAAAGFGIALVAAGLMQGLFFVVFGDSEWPKWAIYLLIPGTLAVLLTGTIFGIASGIRIALESGSDARS